MADSMTVYLIGGLKNDTPLTLFVKKELFAVRVANRTWRVYMEYASENPPTLDNCRHVAIHIYVQIVPNLENGDVANFRVCLRDRGCTNLFKIHGSPKDGFYGPYAMIADGYRYPMNRSKFETHMTTSSTTLSSNSLSCRAELFKSTELSDVTLKVQGKDIPAHKIVLAEISPVFRAMFNSRFSEATSNLVQIDDFEEETISELLKFMYAHELPKFRTTYGPSQLYAASNKYDVQQLKAFCRFKLLSTLSVETALDVLELGDAHSDDGLKEAALKFVCENPTAMDDVPKYEEIIKKRPGLLRDILGHTFKRLKRT